MALPFVNFKKNPSFIEQVKALNAGNETVDIEQQTMPVDEKRINEWNHTLRRYKNSRSLVDARIKNNEKFWQMRQWKGVGNNTTPSTAWLFSCIQSKLADVMDSYPTANLRPRQKDDVDEAKRLSSIVPVIMAQNDFETTYRDVSEYALKNGVGVYHVRWDGTKLGGLGDITVQKVNVLDIFFEPGISDIQDSTYVFKIELVEKDALRARYPDKAPNIRGKVIEPSKFVNDERVDYSNKVVVVDVYYKKDMGNGKKVLHFCKYADNTCLESTENDSQRYPNGLYDHGMYPFVVQSLYHVEDSIYGTGMVDVGADTQIQIDLMNAAVVQNTLMGAKPRFLTTRDASAAEAEFSDWTKTFITVGSISDTTIRPVDTTPLQGNYLQFIQSKIEELKHVTSNQDVNNGAAPSGIIAASAIAALQETSGKDSRFINKKFHGAYGQIVKMIIELIRQFYDIPRWFRIVPDQSETFVQYDNSRIKGAQADNHVPEFDIEITTEKANPYKKMEVNELALSFFKMGFFNPQMTDQALSCLSLMDFDHKDDVIEMIEKNGTLMQQLMMYQQVALRLAQKYGDIASMQLIAQDMAQHGQAMPNGGGVDVSRVASPEHNTGEAKHIEDARARARGSTEAN